MNFDYGFDNLNPIDKLRFFTEHGLRDIVDVSNCIAVALHVLNQCFTNRFALSLVYVLGDQSIISIIEHCFGYDVFEIKNGLILLDYSDLIYRFTCAKKFNIETTDIKQLRINSWGQEYIRYLEPKDINKFFVDKEKCCKYIENEITTNIGIYEQLVEHIKGNISEKSSLAIKSCNQHLLIKLVS